MVSAGRVRRRITAPVRQVQHASNDAGLGALAVVCHGIHNTPGRAAAVLHGDSANLFQPYDLTQLPADADRGRCLSQAEVMPGGIFGQSLPGHRAVDSTVAARFRGEESVESLLL